MQAPLNHIDLDSIPFTGKGYTADRSLRDLALEVILARFHHRSKLAQIAKDMRNLGDHPKAAIDYHFKTGHRERA